MVDAGGDDDVRGSPVIDVGTCARAQLLLHGQLLEGNDDVGGVAARENAILMRHFVERTTRLEVVLQNVHYRKEPILLQALEEGANAT